MRWDHDEKVRNSRAARYIYDSRQRRESQLTVIEFIVVMSILGLSLASFLLL